MKALQVATAELLASRPKRLHPHELHANAAPPTALTRCGTLKRIQLHEADLVYAMDASRRRLVAGASEHMASTFGATFRGVLAGDASPPCHHHQHEEDQDGCCATRSATTPLAAAPLGLATRPPARARHRSSLVVSGASFEVAAAIEAAAIAAIPDSPEAIGALPPATLARKARMADRRLRPIDPPPRAASSNLLVRDPRFSSDMIDVT